VVVKIRLTLEHTEEYNGTSWTTTNPLNTTRRALGGVGIQTAALAFGGYTSPPGLTGYQIQRKNMTEQVGQLLQQV
jgi:hypothetical protein